MISRSFARSFGARSLAALLSCATASATTTVAWPAFAQSDEDKAAARQLATDGAKAMDAKKWADAIDLFSRAESLVHSPQHLLFLARAHVQLGKLVKAREYYLKIVKEEIPPAKKAWVDAKTAAQAEIGAIEPKIPQLKIMVEGGDLKTVVVTIDGALVNSALVGVSRPMDPGEHKLEAKDGGMSATATVTLAEGGNETVTLKLEGKKGGDPPPPDPKDTPPPDKKDPAAPPPEAPSRIVPFTLIGVGVAGLAVGTIFLLSWQSKQSDADALCKLPGGKCPSPAVQAKAQTLDDEWKQARLLSFIGYGVGAVAVGVGVTLLLTAKSPPPPTSGWVRPWVSLGSVGLVGAF